MTTSAPDNAEIAEALRRVADLLQAQDANPFRVRAYRRASDSVEQQAQSVADVARQRESAALERLPEVGKSIAASIRELVRTGRLGILERLEGNISPEDLFATVPGIGPGLAARIHAELDIESLEDLEVAAHDGRLRSVPGIGDARLKGIRDSLAATLSQSARRRARRPDERKHPGTHEQPPVESLLDVDHEYREKAEANTLKNVAPKRFNPDGEAWLPILHTERGPWHFTVLFSNSSRAHELGKTRDWVVMYYERDGEEAQCTVVTEYQGPLRGRRVVRGRESECRQYYRAGHGPSRAAR